MVAAADCVHVVQVLTDKGITIKNIPTKRDGLAFSQDVVIHGVTNHTLYVANDNNFATTLTVSVRGVAVKVDNPKQFFVCAFDDMDLPGFVPQKIGAFSPEERKYKATFSPRRGHRPPPPAAAACSQRWRLPSTPRRPAKAARSKAWRGNARPGHAAQDRVR